jgi:hypothetical protein
MGSFRSQPDLIKHTVTKNGAQTISFAVTHMCGKFRLIQDGESIWKTLTSIYRLSQTIPKIQSLVFSTVMEVFFILLRS